MPIIQLSSIDLKFQTDYIFNQFNLTVREGQNTCITGASGRGKSSLLKMLQAYLLPQGGNIHVCGIHLTPETASAVRAQMAYVPQNIHLPVKCGSELLHMLNAHSRAEKAAEYLSQLGLEPEIMERSFDEMSGGQKQRIVIAVCMSLERKLLLLDEPTASLDEASIARLIHCVAKLKNTTVISASHNEQWIAATQNLIQL